jgi:hypothetical protein
MAKHRTAPAPSQPPRTRTSTTPELSEHTGGNRPLKRAPRRAGIKGVDISPEERVSLYAAARLLPSGLKEKAGLQLPFTTYFQDPFVAERDPSKGLDDRVWVDWEPNLTDGPTSARFAVVDYNADTGALATPAEWNEPAQKFCYQGKALDGKNVDLVQFRQVSVWALLQQTLAFFEDANGLGRSIPWAFEGNRLIVVPHAGFGQNAYYDRQSKSLQFYYFESEADGKTVYTCLSSDIVRHEFGHAVLDGIRPLLNESSSPQTAAFHEFMGDLTAILTTLRNNRLRGALAQATKGQIEDADAISSIAEEFGKAVSDKPYLRSARNRRTMSSMVGETEPHDLSEVLTGAMFDILIEVARQYQREQTDDSSKYAKATPKQAFWRAAERMQRMAIQPLDLLPPAEATFRDYALAVCRAQRLADPIDPRGYYDILLDAFRKREILTDADLEELRKPVYLQERLRLSVCRNIDEISRSRAAAYQFLDDNREDLLIPANCDFFVSDLYDALKNARQNRPLPRQIILEYVWREEIQLQGRQFGRFDGRTTNMLCGGTLVFDEIGNLQASAMKPGSRPYGGKRNRAGAVQRQWEAAVAEGTERRKELLENLAAQIAAGAVGPVIGTEKGILGSQVRPITAEGDDEIVCFRLSPHLNLSKGTSVSSGERSWELSC